MTHHACWVPRANQRPQRYKSFQCSGSWTPPSKPPRTDDGVGIFVVVFIVLPVYLLLITSIVFAWHHILHWLGW